VGDDPEEYWFECDDCEGTGRVDVPDDEQWDQGVVVEATCPGCDGLGVVEGEADDAEV
jgi:DnaJ-class molecular chaperone